MTTSPPSSSDREGSASAPASSSFELLHERVQQWVWSKRWPKLREIQEKAIAPILKSDRDAILAAGTAAGKTEAAFLPLCSGLVDDAGGSVRVLCVSPLKALINDQFVRMEDMCSGLGIEVHRWHGDVSAATKRRAMDAPSGILLITPESLEAMFVLQGHRLTKTFARLDAVVLDELHAYIGTERGRQLQSLLHRLELALHRRIRRIGLSATLGDMSLAAQYLRRTAPELVDLIESHGDGKEILLQVRGYRERAPQLSAGPSVGGGTSSNDADTVEWHVQAIAQHLFEQLRGGHHLAFANSRRAVELYADRLRRLCEMKRVPNEFFPHHGSLSKDLREDTEQRLKDRSMPATAICTSTLELGIDIGDVESVAQVGTPFSVASLRQRLGRSGRRDDPATLRVYVSEPEITPASPLLDKLHTELVQAVAMVELLIARWCEPPEIDALHLSTLVQQVLSVIAQHGGVHAGEAWIALCKTGPFASVDQSRFALLLRSMGRTGLIEQSSDGTLVLGEKGEQIVNHFSFYAVFSSREEFRVETASQVLGSMAFDLTLTTGIFIIFGGRRWKVIGVDAEAKVVTVEPAPGGRVPRFDGARGGLVHDRIRTKMREVYESGDLYAYLNADAKALLTEARQAYTRLTLDSTVCVSDGADTMLFLCRGDRILGTAAVLLVARGLKLEVTGPAITIKECDPPSALAHLRAVCTAPERPPEELAAHVANKSAQKYDWVLDEPLLCTDYAARDLAVPQALAAFQQVLDRAKE